MLPPNKQLFNSVFEIIADHFCQSLQQPGPLSHFANFEKMQSQLDLAIKDECRSNDQLLEDVKTYLKYSVNTQHTQFFNQLFSGVFPAAQVGELLAAITNTTGATFEAAPIATLIEKMAPLLVVAVKQIL
jgi:hypothetical protein